MTLRWLRRRRAPGPRLAQSVADPVAVALAEAAAAGPLVQQFEDVDPVLEELPNWIDVEERADVAGFDTVVGLADEIHAYTDPATSGLELAISEQPGIDAVFAEDREVVHLRTRLALEDVRAGVVRAVVSVNRDPRPTEPDPTEVTDEQVYLLADAVAPSLAASGFVRRAGSGRRGLYFHRVGGHGFVQSATLFRGLGELTDGTSMRDKVEVHFGVRVPERARQGLPNDLNQFAVAACTLTGSAHCAPTPEAVHDVLRAEVLPWLDGTRSRDALARWVVEDPTRIFPPSERPGHARLLAEWGHPDAAQALLKHLRRREWRRMLQDPDAVAAQRILDAR